MANPEHLATLKRGVDEWNAWRKEHHEVLPELSEADLSGAILNDSNLGQADLSGARLVGTIFGGTDLSDAKFNNREAYRGHHLMLVPIW